MWRMFDNQCYMYYILHKTVKNQTNSKRWKIFAANLNWDSSFDFVLYLEQLVHAAN